MDKRYTKECSLRTSASDKRQDLTASMTTLAEPYERTFGAMKKGAGA